MADVSLERLKKIPLMEKLTEAEVKSLQPRADEIELEKGEILFNEGDPITLLFYVEQGLIEEAGTLPDGRSNIPRRAGPGEYLGRYAAVTGRPSPISAEAVEDTTLLAIPLRDLQPILFDYPGWQSWFFRTDVAARLRAIPLFQKFDDWDLYFLADRVDRLDKEAGATVYRAGDAPDGMYVIDRGQVVETLSPTARPADDWPRYHATGNAFGRYDLSRSDPRPATATTRRPTRLFRIPNQTLQELDQTRDIDLTEELEHIDITDLLGQIDLFSDLPDDKLRLLAGYVSLIYHRPGEIVSRQGEPATSLMILADGEAIVRRQVGEGQPRPVGYMKAHPGQDSSSVQARWTKIPHFGDHALLVDEIRGATVEVTEDSTWVVLQKKDLRRFLDDANLTPADLKETAPRAEEAEVAPPSRAERLQLPYVTRRHWIVLVERVLPLVVTLIGLLLLAVTEAQVLKDLPEAETIALAIGVSALVLLIPWTIWRIANWANDTLEVTNEVVSHTEKVPFPFPREDRNEAPLAQIQNVNIDIGVLGRIFGYGTLSVDTAAIRGQVSFTRTPEPAAVQDLIQQAASQARGGREVQLRESIRKNLEEGLFPQRLKPALPESALMSPEELSSAEPDVPQRRPGWDWLRFELWEEDRVTWRKHWLNLVQRVGLPLLVVVLTTLISLASLLAALNNILRLGWRLPALFATLGTEHLLCLPILILWVFAVLWVNYQFQDWRNDVYIVTDSEVIDVQRELAIFPLWFIYTESRREAPLARVQNVNLQIPNLVATLLGYGDVIVQTAGAEGTLDFLFVGNPRHVQAEVLRRVSVYQERERQRDFDDRWGGMSQWFRAYRDLIESEDKDED